MLQTLTPILSVIISILLVFFYVKPEFEKIRETRTEIATHKAFIDDASAFSARVSGDIAKKNQLAQSSQERLNILVPKTLDSTRLLIDLEGIAKSKGVLFGNLTVGEIAEPGEPQANPDGSMPEGTAIDTSYIDVSFEIIGTYEQFKNFVRALETSLSFVEITEISFSSDSENEFAQYSFTVRAFGQTIE